MTGQDSSPNFDWLKGGPPPGKGNRPIPPHGDKSSPPEDENLNQPRPDEVQAPQEESVFDEGSESTSQLDSGPAPDQPLNPVKQDGTTPVDETENDFAIESSEPSPSDTLPIVPAPILNASDGTTVILSNRQFSNDEAETQQFESSSPPNPSNENPAESNPQSDEDAKSKEHPADEVNAFGTTQIPVKDSVKDDPEASDEEAPEQFDGSTTGELDIPPSLIDTSELAQDLTEEQPTAPADLTHFSEAEINVFDDPGFGMPQGSLDSGKTEVLNSEDLAKAREAWPVFTEALSKATGSRTAHSQFQVPFSDAGSGQGVAPPSQSEDSQERPSASPSRMFIVLASYASAITLAFLVLLLKQAWENGHPHQLESLPDIATQKEGELTYVPAHSGLPAGHTLEFGQTQRFGNILVEPLEISRGPVEFIHYSGDPTRKHEPTLPVWKLKIRLTNVSKDQSIAPLDRRLVLRWVSKSNQKEYANYYIAERGTKSREASTVQLYRLPVDSDWDLVGQDLGKTLQPGESYETFLVSTEEGLDVLPEHLVWRVQIRKGYSPSGNGVTTIFQVAFDKKDVKDEVGEDEPSQSQTSA